MQIFSGGQPDFFGLDIGTTAVRAVQLKTNKQGKSLVAYAELPLDARLYAPDAVPEPAQIAQAVTEVVKKAGITTKNLTANLPSNKVFTTLIDMAKLNPDEMAKAIAYQAPSLIPTPLPQSKLDWAVIGPVPKDANKVEVLLSSVPNEFVEARLDMLEKAGFNVLAFEPDNMALVRSLVPAASNEPYLLLDMGHGSSDVVIAMAGAPRLARTLATGSEQIVKAAMQNLSVERGQAEQFVFKFGLSHDKLQGQVYTAILPTVDSLLGEIDKSIKFFQERYTNQKIEKIIVTGAAAVLPELPLYVANKFALSVEIGNAWRNVLTPPDKQNELIAVANHFAVAAGMAERSV